MARRILLIKHEDSPRDDRAAALLAKAGFALDWRYPYKGDELEPPTPDLAGVVLYGGPQSVPDIDEHPCLAREAELVRQATDAQVPVLGLCLGGQVVAHALGAKVEPGREGYHEFGYYPLHPTREGQDFAPEGLVVTQAHFHEFEIPKGAVHLASSDLFRNQAFRYGHSTYAFQFHPEITIPGFRRWQAAEWAPYGKPGVQSREQQDLLAAAHDPKQHRWMADFMAKLFGHAEDGNVVERAERR